uniref:Reverse transcriptase domain-containing protein n=1 Tax=Tanacetum cinerariifolium TaxID=118510 RepID=A0A699I6D4_TANCI|nr:reverse transcriptase domain-containing protein [Tanacetum cinerariifolium]
MAPKKRTTRASPATTTTTTTPVTDAQLKALIDQGLADALAARDADRSRNGKDSHDSGTGGTEVVVELTQWFERIETVFRISNYIVENQIKFAICTLLGSALTWCKSHVKTVGHDVTFAMTWTNLKKKMTNKYYPRGKIKKPKVEMWNLKVKGTNVVSYNQCFQELALMCARMFLKSRIRSRVEFATELLDKKIRLLLNVGLRIKRSKMITNNKKIRGRTLAGPTLLGLSPAATKNQRNLTYYESGNQGHYRSDFLELKNQNHRNQAEGTRARGMAHALGGGETNQDLNNMEDDINV